jgi:predicted Fe-Mo cluster-binding NifX family protein
MPAASGRRGNSPAGFGPHGRSGTLLPIEKETPMKIAITSQGTGLDSDVDPRFGRARWLLVYDLEAGTVDVFDNLSNRNAMQGAGIQAAQNVADQGVSHLLTGHCGPNAFRALSAAGVQVVVGVDGSVQDAIDQFKRGELAVADRPDVEGHWT